MVIERCVTCDDGEFLSNVGASSVNSDSSDEESSEPDQMNFTQHKVLYASLKPTSLH